MSSIVSAGAGDVSRQWRLPNSAAVQLRHHTVLGSWSLSIDGSDQPAEGRATLIGGKAFIPYVANGMKGYITIEPRPMAASFAYACWAGDPATQQVEENDLPAQPTTQPGYKVAVAGCDLVLEDAGSMVAFFKLQVTRQSDGAATLVHRRHREFYALGETVVCAYKGSMLERMFPPLPSRTVPFAQNQLDPAFLEQRRAELHNQIVKLESIPRMRVNVDFLAFCGIVDSTRESSVIFPPGSSMGLSLKNGGAFTEVEAIKPGPAETAGTVRIGSKVSKIQGEDVLDQPYDLVIGRLKACPRPMVVHFLTDLASGTPSSPPAQAFAGFVGSSPPASAVSPPAPAAEQVTQAPGLADVDII